MTPEQIAKVASLVTGMETDVLPKGPVVYNGIGDIDDLAFWDWWNPDFEGDETQIAQAALLVRWIAKKINQKYEAGTAIRLMETQLILSLVDINDIEKLHELVAILGEVDKRTSPLKHCWQPWRQLNER